LWQLTSEDESPEIGVRACHCMTLHLFFKPLCTAWLNIAKKKLTHLNASFLHDVNLSRNYVLENRYQADSIVITLTFIFFFFLFFGT
jgi:hypothetical protein